MVDILAGLLDGAAIITALASVILLYFTFLLRAENRTLREATQSLESLQVRPKVVLGQDLYFDLGRKAIIIEVVNRGVGTAFDTKVYAKIGDSERIQAAFVTDEKNPRWSRDRNLIPFTGTTAFSFQDIRAKGVEILLTVEFMDIRKKVYEESILDMAYTPTPEEVEATTKSI